MDDYAIRPQSAQFDRGVENITITVFANRDEIFEEDETFMILLESDRASLLSDPRRVIIRDPREL